MLMEGNPSFVEAQKRADYAASPAGQAELDSQMQAEVEAQAQKDREAAELAEAARAPGANEVLFDGVEKLGPGSYKLTVPSADGADKPEVFYGNSQAELFAKLRKSKGYATTEIRRRSKSVQVTPEMRKMQVERVDYPFIQPLQLTSDQIYTLTEERAEWDKKLKDPAHVLEAKRKLREIDGKLELASLSTEECTRRNGEVERRAYAEGNRIAVDWISANRARFYNCQENIKSMQDLMGLDGLNWAVTFNNMTKAFEILQTQGVLWNVPRTPPSLTLRLLHGNLCQLRQQVQLPRKCCVQRAIQRASCLHVAPTP